MNFVTERSTHLESFAGVAAVIVLAAVLVAFRVLGGPSSSSDRVILHGTGLAPHAHGSVDIERYASGFGITLVAHGLPALSAGHYYEAWLAHGVGAVVSIGTFSATDTTTTLWSGVSPNDYPTVTVTLEKRDDHSGSSRHLVLAGVVSPRT